MGKVQRKGLTNGIPFYIMEKKYRKERLMDKILTLRPFVPEDAAAVVSWLTDKVSMHKWCADCFDVFPLPPETLASYYEEHNGAYLPYMAMDGDTVVGHLFLKPTDRETVRICFVILDPSKRGKGYGKALMRAALETAFTTLQARTAALAVFDNNPEAYHCYVSVGFRDKTPEPPLTYPVMGEYWKCRSMTITLEEWRILTLDIYKDFAKQKNVTAIPCWNGAEMLLQTDAGEDSYVWYSHDLEGHGYEPIGHTELCGNYASVYKKDDAVYTLSYTPFNRTCRLIKDKTTALPPEPDNSEPTAAPLVTQMRLLYCCADCGMIYIIRLGDGRFAVIDSGMGEHEEPEHLLELLNEQNVREGKPVIAAWFFTHPHIDHYNTFVNMMERHRDEVVLETILFNWPTEDKARGFSDLTRFNALLPTLTETKIITPRDGWQFVYPGVTFTVLYTCEDLYPEAFSNINDTSMIMRMDVGDRRVLWMGDGSAAASDWLTKKYDRETLACEIMQVGHHGYWGGSDLLHRTVDPEVLLWPCPDFWYQVITKWDCNRYLVESEKIHTIFVGGQQETVLDMTAPIVKEDPYPETGDVVYAEDFTDTNVYHKAWSSVTGGRTGYRGMGITIDPGVCHCSAGEAWSVLEWVQPGRMPDSYRMTFHAEVKKPGTAALFWNHPTPTEWSDDAILPLELPENRCVVVLTADESAGKSVLTLDGKTVWERDYTPAEKHGMYLLLKNAAVDVFDILVEKL